MEKRIIIAALLGALVGLGILAVIPPNLGRTTVTLTVTATLHGEILTIVRGRRSTSTPSGP
ncbi:MAG: hypothetical protein ABDH63_07270 [Candidatus Caldarchaeales archaeon]